MPNVCQNGYFWLTMATVKYLLRSKVNKQVPIYASISLSRNKTFREKTGLTCSPNDWSEKKSYPKQTNADLKFLNEKLKKLESYLFDQFNKAQANGVEIDKEFVVACINQCFQRKSEGVNDLFLIQVGEYIEKAPFKKVKNKSTIGLSENTIKNWKSFKRKVERFGQYRNKKIRLSEDALRLTNDYKDWAFDVEGYGESTVGKDLAFFRQIFEEAEKKGIEVSSKARLIESFSANKIDRHIITLSFDELEKIENTQLKRKALQNARQWLLIGCELGQRGGDLLEIDFNKIRVKSAHKLIDVFQKKTKKWVTIPITHRAETYLSEGIPEKISLTKFNELLKELLEEAGLNEMVTGKKIIVNPETKAKRSILGKYPKYELVTSHTCRRSFATNYYKKLPTPLIMDVTGHSKESTFLDYINKPRDKDHSAIQFLNYLELWNQKGEL